MTTFVETSALYAAIVAEDANHQAARDAWVDFVRREERLVTTNYVLLETAALLGRRLGLAPVRDFQALFVPLIHAHWVDEALHERGVSALLTANERSLSLVDCVSFEAMRQLGLVSAFTLDAQFVRQGFDCIPRP